MGFDVADHAIHDSRGDHQPHGAGRVQLPRELFERRCARSAEPHETLDSCGIPVVHDACVSGTKQAGDHTRAHSSKAYHAELHGDLLWLRIGETSTTLSRG